jgi:uroporphyrinogen decarboxylase
MELAANPELCTEVTCRPVEDLGVDAAILFSDIMVPLAPMGVVFQIKESVGPIIAHPIRTGKDVEGLKSMDPMDDLPFVIDAIGRITTRLGGTPLIGFAGGPFTLASYLVEGGSSRNYAYTKRLMWTEPMAWDALMNKLTDMVIRYLSAQIAAGAQAVQVFDSWVGALAPQDYRDYVLPYMFRLFSSLKPLSAPRMYFGVGTGSLLELMAEAGPDVLSIDWRVPLTEARQRLGSGITLQGNLDPVRVTAGFATVAEPIRDMVLAMKTSPGYIFNLGHGVLPETSPEVLQQIVRWVHQTGGTE